MKKRLILCLLMIGLISLLFGCQSNNPTVAMKPIDEYGIPSVIETKTPDSPHPIKPVLNKQQIASGELSDKTKYIVYSDNSISLSDHDLTVKLIDEPMLTDHIE